MVCPDGFKICHVLDFDEKTQISTCRHCGVKINRDGKEIRLFNSAQNDAIERR
jgi:hypothetical protein